MTFIIPYRDREKHLVELIPHLVQHGRIIVVEQCDDKPFNRGKMINIGFKYIDPQETAICIHDVDMIPVKVNYALDSFVWHLAGKVQQFIYRMPYKEYFGGVVIFPVDSFSKINGFSNEYWGWGAEDDDLYRRCASKKIKIFRQAGRFDSLPHPHQKSINLHKENLITLKKGLNFDSGLSDCMNNVKIISKQMKDYTLICAG
jgi:beta-1,4-galactosyltransferase 6